MLIPVPLAVLAICRTGWDVVQYILHENVLVQAFQNMLIRSAFWTTWAHLFLGPYICMAGCERYKANQPQLCTLVVMSQGDLQGVCGRHRDLFNLSELLHRIRPDQKHVCLQEAGLQTHRISRQYTQSRISLLRILHGAHYLHYKLQHNLFVFHSNEPMKPRCKCACKGVWDPANVQGVYRNPIGISNAPHAQGSNG